MPHNSHTLRATHLILTLGALLIAPCAQAVLRVSTPAGGTWNVGATWVGGTPPAPSDTVEIVSGANVTVGSATSILGVVVDAGGTLTIGATLTMNHGANPTADVVVDGTINVTAGGNTFVLGAGANCVVRTGGFIRNNSSSTTTIWSGVTSANLTFQAGATYAHDKTGGNTIAPATWNAGSTNLLDYIASSTTVPTIPAGSVFANVTINIPSGTSAQNTAGNLNNIAGHLVVLNTGGAGNDFRLCANTSPTITIGGNVQVLGGILNLVSGTGIPIITINGVMNVSAPGWLRSSGSGQPVLTVNGNSGKLVAASGGTNTFSADWANPPGSPVADAITLDNGVYGADGADFTLNANRGITLNAAGGYIYTTSGRTLTIPGNITGPGGLTKIYPGGTTVNMTFSGVNDFAGDFVITGGGVRFNSSTAAGKGKVIVTMPAGGTANTTLRNLGVISSTLTNDVVFNANNGLLITLDSDVANTFIMSGKFSGIGAVRHGVNSGGTVVLSGDNSAWSGGLTQQRGTTVLGHKNALGTGTLTIAPATVNGAMPVSLQASTPLTGVNAVANPIVFALPGPNTNWTVSGNNDLELSGPMTLGITAGTTQIITNNNAGATIFSGNIGGPPGLGLTIRGTGTLTLSGNNTYSGPTVVSGGTLSVSSSSSVGSGSVTVNGGTLTLAGSGNIAPAATLNINGAVTVNLNYAGTMTINALFLDGILQAPGTWGAPASGAAHTDARFAGTGILNIPFYIVLNCSPNITAVATSPAGAVVSYSSSATGNCPPINVNCAPPSGSTFPIGTTIVTCTATDSCGTITNCSFTVTVLAAPGKEYFSKDNALPPTNGVYISPELYHALFAQGIVIQDVAHRDFTASHPSPGPGTQITHIFGSEVDFRISTDGGATFQPTSATANVQVTVSNTATLGQTTFYSTEMQALDFSVVAGGQSVMLRESPTLQSKGQTTVRTVPGGYLISSFFDVFTELSLDSGVTWSPATSGPVHVELRTDPTLVPAVATATDLLPPPQDKYVSPDQWHAQYALGIVIKDASHDRFTQSFHPPTSGTNTESFNSAINASVSTDGGLTFSDVSTTSPAQVEVVKIGSPPNGMFDTEISGLSFTLPGGAMIRESPTLPSRGATQIDPQADGTFKIHSFFDVFTELSVDGGATWQPGTNGPVRMQLTPKAPEVPKPTPNLPPPDGAYVSPADWHAAYANGIIISNASHDRFTQTQPPPPPGGNQTENFGSTVGGMISMDGGATFQPFSAPAGVQVQVNSRADFDSGPTRFFDTEMLSLQLSGGTLPGGVMVRESPSKASLGRTSIRQGPQPLPWNVSSFFDIFTELSLDGGANWSPQVTRPATMFLTTNPPATTLTITCPSNITVTAASPAGAVVFFTIGTSGGCPPINVVASPPSGSTFPVGTTTVTATATDGCGGFAQCQFSIHVKLPPPDYFFPQPLLPPQGSVYISPAQWHVLYAQGIIIRDVRHRFFTQHFPPPPLGATETHSFGSEVDFEVSFDNGNTFAPGSGTANVTVQVTHSSDAGGQSFFDTEMLALDLVGQGFMLRESPTLQSKGQTTVRSVPGGYLISSFFDVFTEISTDGAVSWHPADGPGHVECHPDPTEVPPAPAPTSLLPPPNGTYISPQLWHALYAQGVVIRDVRHKFFTGSLPPPPPGATNTHNFDSQLDLQVSTDGGNTYQYVRVAAPVQVTVASHGSNSDTIYDTEMTSLGLTLPGGIMLRESPSLPSRGQTQLTAQPDGTYQINSFFDVFTELSLDGGASWSGATNGPVRMELITPAPEVPKPTPNLPPLDGSYISPADWHAAYANGIIITNASHDRFTQTQPPPPPGGSQTENFGSRITGQISMNGGASFQPFSAPAGVQVQVTSSQDSGPTRFFNTEMLSLSLQGGTLPAGVMVRESPSKASLGRTSVRQTAAGYAIDSFFDVFTEVSLDGGQTWSPGVTHPGTMGLNPPPTNVPPIVLTCSANITVPASSAAGAVVTYSSSASGGCPPVVVNCNPPSGSTFPIGTTTVTCLASDACGQTANCSFQVTVVRDIFNPTNTLPPSNTVYVSPALYHVAYANGIIIRDIRHRKFTQHLPPPILGTSQIHTFTSELDFETSNDGGATWQPVTTIADCTVQVTHTLDDLGTSFFDTEMLSILATWGPIRIRESPTKASLGRTSIQPSPGGFMISSFFDIFTEISLDNGATWTPADGSAHVEMRRDPREDPPVTEPTPVLPAPNDAYVSPDRWHALYAQGIVISNVSHKFFTQTLQPPPPGGTNQHNFNSVLDLDVSLDGGQHFQSVRASAPVTVNMESLGSSPNSPMYDAEMASLTTSIQVGGQPVMIRESPTRRSQGEVQMDQQPDGSWRIGSFFDIFPEISLDGGATWSGSTSGPVHMQLTQISPEVPSPSNTLPITNAPYISPQQWHAAYANGIYISNVMHRGFTQGYPPPPAPGGSNLENFGSTVELQISLDGGATFQSASCQMDVSVQVTHRPPLSSGLMQVYDTEMLSLTMSGGTLPPNIRLRESPSKASLGRTSIRPDPQGGFRIGSFFDVFTEISMDGGATWTPQTNRPALMAPRLVPRKRFFPQPNLPPGNGQYISPKQWHALYASGIIVSNVSHKRFLGNLPPPPPRSTNIHNFGSIVTMLIKLPGQPSYIPVTANADCQASVANSGFQSTERVFQNEMLSLNISGGTLPPGVMIRESPTKRSTGETHYRGGGGGAGGFRISSFFDIFTEVTMDGGQTWTPADSASYMELHIDPGVPPTTVLNPRVVSGVPTFTVQSQIGLRYLLQYKNSLTDATWTTTTITSGTGEQLDLIDCCPPPGPSRPHRFYRVEIQEDDSQ